MFLRLWKLKSELKFCGINEHKLVKITGFWHQKTVFKLHTLLLLII